MKTNILKQFFVLTILACVSGEVSAQTKLTGKTFISEAGATCRDGIGMIYTYRILDFKNDSVIVSYRVVESVIPEKIGMYEHMYDNLKKIFKWNVNKNILTIENCKEFNKMTIQESTLISQDGEMKPIIFEEETK